MTTIAAIEKALEKAMQRLQSSIRKNLELQGHVNTGRLRDSIQYEITPMGDSVKAVIECEDYGLALEFGVPASRIPFGNGTGETSKYIQGLITFFESKGLQGRDAVGAAFATAYTHKREGMPSIGSAAFSRTGERTGWANAALEQDLNVIASILEETTGYFLQIELGDTVRMEPMVIYT
jgi:hypothetical protein